jgi:replicative DNA helicase
LYLEKVNQQNQGPEPIRLEPITSSADAGPRLINMADLIEEIATAAESRYKAKREGKAFGPITGLPSVDKEWGGAIPNGVHMVLGGPGVGKTAFALQVAGSCRCPCLYLTCEMSPAELIRRTASRVTGEFLGKFKDGTLSGQIVRQKLAEAALECPNLAIADGTSSYASPEWLRDMARTVKRDAEHVLIVVDSLHSWADSAAADATEYDQTSGAVRDLRAIAAQLECPVIAISERNRASFGKGAAKDKVNAGAGSRKIEYGAESVINLEHDEKAMSTVHEKVIDLNFAKNRNGAKGESISFIFEGRVQRYREA